MKDGEIVPQNGKQGIVDWRVRTDFTLIVTSCVFVPFVAIPVKCPAAEFAKGSHDT